MFFFDNYRTIKYRTVRYRTFTVRYGTVLGDTIKTSQGGVVHSENVSPLGTRRRVTLTAFLLPRGHSYEGDKNAMYKVGLIVDT